MQVDDTVESDGSVKLWNVTIPNKVQCDLRIWSLQRENHFVDEVHYFYMVAKPWVLDKLFQIHTCKLNEMYDYFNSFILRLYLNISQMLFHRFYANDLFPKEINACIQNVSLSKKGVHSWGMVMHICDKSRLQLHKTRAESTIACLCT